MVVRGSGNFETKVISSSSELNWSTNISIEAMSSDDMDKIMDSIMSLSTLSIAFLHHEFTSKLRAVHFLRKLREEGDNPILYSTKTPLRKKSSEQVQNMFRACSEHAQSMFRN